MVFSSAVFLFLFLPVVLLLYYACPERHRNHVALVSSYFFYAWGAPTLVCLLIGSSVFDFVISRHITPSSNNTPPRRKRLLTLAVGANIAALLYFKYANFFVAEIQNLLGVFGMTGLHWRHVVLPIGISFFTFQKISYLVDVYRGTARPPRSVTDYMLYVSLFPQLIAGPIVRYHDIAQQLEGRAHTYERFISGVWRFGIGLAKKALIANVLGQVADRAFDVAPAELPLAYAWVGIVCYAFQIYFDFSGYSDMAIGLGRMMGFEFLENFNCPYISRNFSEFWRRWHISLSTWMREYLYVPLGGNRCGKVRTYMNLWIVFLFSGLWHGAAWNFLVWGAFHGVFLSADKAFSRTRLSRVPALLAIPVTFPLILVSWVLFRAPDLQHAAGYLERMFSPAAAGIPGPMAWSSFLGHHATLVLGIAFFVSFAPALAPPSTLATATNSPPAGGGGLLLVQYVAGVVLLVLSAAALSASGFNPFIYFRF